MDTIVAYIRSWFPEPQIKPREVSTRKRGSTYDESDFVPSPKYSRVLSQMWQERQALESSRLRPTSSTPRVLDLERHRKPTESDDVIFLKSIQSTTEKRLNAQRSGQEYVTRFTPNCRSVTTKSPLRTPHNGISKAKHRMSPVVKMGKKSTPAKTSPSSLNYSFRLDEKKKYQMLLESVQAMNAPMDESSIYGTPVGSLFNRSRRLVELARSPSEKKTEFVDLTEESTNRRLSTKDCVIKVLDDFETAEIEDSDSDVEVLPAPPSPKPDIRVDPINSLRTVIDTSRASKVKWLDDLTEKHARYLEDKSKEVQTYLDNSSTLQEINRDLLIKNLTQKVQHSLAIKDTILPVIEDEEDTELAPLTDEQNTIVKRAFSGNPNEILTKKFNLNVNRRDILTLAGLSWLNDNIINFYMNLITERGTDSKWPKAYTMNTFFYQKLTQAGPESLRRWTRKVDIFAHDLICVPIHLGMHWCMAIIYLKEKTIKYFDSMGKPNNKCLTALREYLEYEHQDKKGAPFSTQDFALMNVQEIPQQMNGSDCGVFSCTFAEYATRNARFSFQQEDMPYIRRKMVVEIVTGQLLLQ